MELPSQEAAEMPIPLNSTYGGGSHGHVHAHHHPHAPMIHHHHHDNNPTPHNHIIIPSPGGGGPQIPPLPPTTTTPLDNIDHVIIPFKKMIRYRECLKNHAASMGGNATDGCGEFMPSGDEGTLEALTCSACNCHRNFHRKEIEGEHHQPTLNSCDNCPRMGRKIYVGNHHGMGYHHHGRPLALPPSHHHHHQMMMMSYNNNNIGGGSGGGGSLGSDQSDEQDAGGGGVVARPPHMVKKRFRTKFSQEQKEKMLSFAERVGWKIQKQEESVVQQFCQEVGVKRRVLKVWMHNNKHSLAKKNNIVQNHQATNPHENQV